MKLSDLKDMRYRLMSVPVTLLAVALVILLKTPNPMMILIIPVVFFTYSDGYVGGILSGLVAVAYSFIFFSNPGELLSFDPQNVKKVMTIVCAVSTVIFLVGRLKRRDRAHVDESARLTGNFIKILSGMDVQILVTEPGTDRVLFANSKMNKGDNVDFDPVGKPCWQVYHGLDERCGFCPLQQLYDNPETPVEWEWLNERTGHWFHNRESLIEWTDGRLVHLQQGVDITEIKRTAELLIRAKEDAEQSNKAKSEFLSRMSHEIRTPMNAIIGMTGIAAKSDDLVRIHECLAKVDDASVHLLGVINDILDMSKIEAGKFELAESDFVLEHMLQRVSSVNSLRFEQKGQHFSIVMAPDVPTAIVADKQRLAQVITNLLSNAAKFTPNEGKIGLSISLVGDLDEQDDFVNLRFVVTDEGIGMTAEQLSRLFRSFEQADGSITRRFGGTGLGLAISKTIVELMGGRISVKSAPSSGSIFIFTIRARRGLSTRSSILSPNVDWSRVRLLTVDQSAHGRKAFAAIAGSLGLEWEEAASADEAVRKLAEGSFQIVFVDWASPELGGLELAREIRQKYPELPLVLVLPAGDWPQVQQEAGQYGITQFIGKPLLPSPIVDCINACLGEMPAHMDPLEASFSDHDIFMGRRILLVEDVEVNREIIKAVLEETGVDLVEAENGQLACELFEKDPAAFDMILMDIHMPVMDGYSATRCIRSLRHLAEASAIPIVAMTANVFREDVERCLAAGMNDHVGKPVNAEDLIKKMKRYMPAGR